MLEKSVATRATFEFAQTHPASENRVKVRFLPNDHSPRVF